MFKLFKTDAGDTIKYNTETGESWLLGTGFSWIPIQERSLNTELPTDTEQ